MDINDYLQKAQQAFEKENDDYAIELLNHILSQVPSTPEARSLLHRAKQRQAKKKGISSLQKILNPFLTLPDFLQAKLWESKKDRWKAINAYEAALSKDPFHSSALFSIATLLAQEKQLADAAQTLEELLSLSPNHLGALKQTAQLYMQLDQEKKARECYERILQIDPKNAEAERSLKNLDALGTIRGMKEDPH